MPAKLRSLKLNRCDLVDRPANPKAHVVLYKRAPVVKESPSIGSVHVDRPDWLRKEAELFMAAAPEAKPDSAESALLTSLRQIIACSYHLYIAAHAAHWNVEGPFFPSWHDFFGKMYEDVHDSIDPLAEAMRQHKAYAPGSFAEIFSAKAPAQLEKCNVNVGEIISLNSQHMAALTDLRAKAEAAGDEGLANFCQDRLAVHLKYDWQLRMMEKS